MKKLILILFLCPLMVIGQTYTGDKFNARTSIKTPLLLTGTDTLAYGHRLVADSIRLNGVWGSTFGQWITTGSDIYYNTGNVGIGTLTPIVHFQVKVSGATTPTILLEDADITFPDYSGVGFAPLTTNSVLQISSGSSVKGGASIRGFTVNTPNTSAIALSGYSGIPMGTVSAISLIGWKHDGSTSRTTLANDEIILNIQNGTGVKTQILGNGFFGINKITPAYALDVSGTANSLYYLLNGTSLKKSIDTVKTSLATGLLKVTNGTGLLSTASAGTDYQAALTNPVTGTGTSGYLATWNGTSTITGATVTESSGALAGITTIGATSNITTLGGYIQSGRSNTTTAYSNGLRTVVASAATSGVPVRNPGIIELNCSAWNTTPTAAPKSNTMAIGLYGISGTTTSSRMDFIDYMADGVSTQNIRMALTSGGLLGIGLTLPASKLHIDAGNATASNLQFTAGTTSGQAVSDGVLFGIGTDAKAIWNNQENTSTEIYTNNTLATTIDASQNLTQVGKVLGSNIRMNTTSNSTIIGINAGTNENLTTTRENTIIGTQAGYTLSTGIYNTFLGFNAGYAHTTAASNTFIGWQSGVAATGGDNTAIGTNSGLGITTGTTNTCIGEFTGGAIAANTGNVFLGYGAGYQTAKSSRFAINNEMAGSAALDSTAALMWGMFNNAALTKQYLKINGNLVSTYYNYGTDAGANDTYTASIPGITAYATGMVIYFYANTVNTGACTINVNGLGAKALKSLHDQDPQDSYIEAGSMVHAIYDGTNFQMLQPDANP